MNKEPELTCFEHDFSPDGIRFTTIDESRVYFRFYCCRKCLAKHAEQMNVHSTVYQEIRYGATPPTDKEREAISNCLEKLEE